MSGLGALLERLLEKRMWIVLVAAVVIALPTLVLGEIAAEDARQRLREAQLRSQSVATERTAARVSNVFGEFAEELALALSRSRGIEAPLVIAARTGDVAGLNAALAEIAKHFSSGAYVYFVDRTGIIAAGYETGPLGTPQTRLVGYRSEPLPFVDTPYSRLGAVFMPLAEFERTFAQPAVYLSAMYEPLDRSGQRMTAGRATGGGGPTSVGRAQVQSGTYNGPRASLGLRVVEDAGLIGALVVDMAPVAFADAALTVGGTATDAYIVDPNGRLAFRGRLGPDDERYRDLSDEPVVRTVLDGGRVRGEAEDPLGAGPRLVTSAVTPEVPGHLGMYVATGWHVISTQPLDLVYGDLEAGMALLRALRIALVAVVIGLGALLMLALGRMLRQQRALRVANADIAMKSSQLEAASQNKSTFLASMSHELRTPLNAVIGFADVMRQRIAGPVTDKQQEYLEDIAAAGRHLLSLVNDVLDLSKVEAGKMELDRSEFSLPASLDESVGFVRSRAEEHRITISLELDPSLGTLNADERKVRQVMTNLLSNAVKFTPDGGHIRVRASRRDGEIAVAVADSGPGIAAGDRERIFEEFGQTEAGARQSEGTGLGLTLSRRFVELHGGRIWVDSEPGRGSTFTFALPLLPKGTPVPE